ncbi:probable disease resistance protein At4g14610 [Vitis riparia]|uniref:probable disease resistance protein At4g14610 n=1 Tax=Vitis riparia TaxID=96939 RepID=UPI00155A20FF|nr:probable disease resistance protein At4g14610 [Vitis riparia]
MASVFQNQDLRKIQGQLVDMLGLKFEEESKWGRATRLNEMIKKEKKILIILDDIWAQLDLEEVGIPFGDDHKGCKIVLTSRNKHVLSNGMGTQKDIPVLHLPEKEALVLFKKTVGDSIDKQDLQAIVINVAKECAALRLFQGTDTLEDTRNRVETLVENLKASNLLLEIGDNAFVRMHDVVHDVALAIASKDHVFSLREGVGLEEWPKLDELQSCSKISLPYNDIHKLPEGLVCPELEPFVLYHISDPISENPKYNFLRDEKA